MYGSVLERLEGRVLFSTLPSGFVETHIATIPSTTKTATMAFAPDGRLFVADTTNDQIRVIKNGVLQATPAMKLVTTHSSERGIDGLTFDPNFATAPAGQKYVYVYYTTPAATPVNRLSRFTMSTSNPDTIDPGSEKILLDNIASTMGNHNGGLLRFGADGKLYLAVGEAGVRANAQDLSNDNGKVLRINPDGSIPSDNPFVNTAGAKPEIFAYGFRNPFSGAMQPGTSNLYVNDVGENTWEEIDIAQKGGNFGWPNAEGLSSDASLVNPIFEYNHNGSAAAITGGAFMTSGNFPASYNGKYLFSDFLLDKVWALDTTTKQATTFATGTAGFDQLAVNPADGTLWCLTVAGGVSKISFTQTQPPPTNTTLTATAASYVQDGTSANTNFGNAPTIQVKKSTSGFNRESYVKFDLSSIAAGAVGSAKLRIFGNLSTTEAASANLSVFGVSNTTWGETTITFANKPAAAASAITSGNVIGTTPQWYEFDITSYIKANAGKQISLDLRGSANSLPIMTFNSDEAATNKPQLLISATPSTGKSLSDIADAYVRDGSSANTNFGNATALQVKKSTPGFTRESYLRFDLSSISSINSAKLELFGGFEATPATPVQIAAFGLDDTTWGESTITYSNRPTGGTQIATLTISDGLQGMREWDLTSYLKSQKAAGHNIVTIALRALDGSTPSASFASDEASANRPQLVIS